MATPASYLCHPLGPRVTCTCDGRGLTLGCVAPDVTQDTDHSSVSWSPTQTLLSLTLGLIIVFTTIR